MTWMIFAILPAMLWAIVNHADKFLIDKYCKDRTIGALILFSSLIGIPIVIIAQFFVAEVYAIGFKNILILIAAGIFYILAVLPYLYALETDDTSSIAPQMLLAPVFTYILGYLFLGEVLALNEIIACALIIFCALGLNIQKEGLKINSKAFLLMVLCAIFMALHIIAFKFVAIDLDFVTSILWTHVGFIVVGILMFVFIKSYRDDFLHMITVNGAPIIGLNVAGEALTVAGNILFSYATLLAPVVIVQTVTEGMQPIFVFVLGVLFTFFIPKFAKEDLSRFSIIKKVFFICLLFIGVFLTAF